MSEKADRPRWFIADGFDIEAACGAVAGLLSLWFEWEPWQDVAQPFPGSVAEWPARETEALAVARREWQAIGAWRQWEAAQRR